MRKYLGKPAPRPPIPYVEERDLELLAADLGAGHFTADQLHTWYSRLIAEEGREPVGKRDFGMALREAGLTPSTRVMEDKGKPTRCWLITLPWVRRGNALLAQEKADSERSTGGSAEMSP